MSRSGFYAWRRRALSWREAKDQELIPVIHDIFWTHKRRYGARRIAAELRRRDILCGIARVAKLLKSQGLRAIQPKSFKPKTTESRHRLGYNDNLLFDRPDATKINEVWVSDITYIPLRTGRFGYTAFLLDLYSRKIAFAPTNRKGLELANRRYLHALRHFKKRVLLRRGFLSGSFAPASVPHRLQDDHPKPRFYASALVVLWAVFCSLLEGGNFQIAFSVFLESKNVRSGFGLTAPRLSRSLPSSAGLFNSSVGIGVGLVDFCHRRPSG